MHWVQLKGFSPEWESMCVLRLLAREAEQVYCAHLKAFLPECVSMCFLRSPLCLQEQLHCAHLKAFLPECVRMCFLRSPVCLQKQLHCLHLKGLSPEWMSRCFLGRQHDCNNICTVCTRKALSIQFYQKNVTNVAKILLLLVFFNIKRKLFDFLTFMNQTHIINSIDISKYLTGTYYFHYPNHVTHIHLIFNKR